MVNREEKNIEDSQHSNYNITQDDEINLYDLWKVIVKRKKIVITIFLISLLGAVIYCLAAPKIYSIETYMKLYMPKDISTVKELPTAKDISSIIGKIDVEKKAIIFLKNPDGVTNAKIDEIKGSNDKFKITIESRDHDNLPTALQEMISFIENMREIKSSYEKIMSELNERIVLVRKADKENDIQIKEIGKRLNNTKVLPVGFDPVAIRQNSVNLKMEKYRIEQEIKNYKMIQPLDDPFISKYPVKPNKVLIIALSSIGSIIFGIFTVLIMESFEKVKKKTQDK